MERIMEKKKIMLLLVSLLWSAGVMAWQAVSPDGRLTVVKKHGSYIVRFQKQEVLQFVAGGADAPSGNPLRIHTDYTMLTGKRRHCTNEANEYRCGSLVLRVYNDGIAFRQPGQAQSEEQTHYRMADGKRRWMMPWTDSYEGFYSLKTASQDGHWAYPVLLEAADGVFALVTESGISRGHSASSLYSEGPVYKVVPAAHTPQTAGGSGDNPWRVVIIGSLADVVQSTLVTDVAEPCQLEDVSWIKPGVVSWIYWAYNHGSNDYNIIRKYVDMAVSLRLPYVLIDAEWDEMKDGKTIADAVAYARHRGVRPLIWYNSSVGWVNGAPGPKFRLNKPEDREREFAWCERLGVAGVKIDFFSGDNQMNMDYCIDLLESAARHHLMVNFHGATIPRGWQRTYPNLMTTEGVYGAEWYNNVPTFTSRAARHNATLPFTRNVIGPMDYTPCTFSDSQHPHITTNAHELALTVLFESGWQHLADRPESYLSQPAEVQQFLRDLPVTWDETRLVSGYLGESVVMARRHGATWYVAGINGTDRQLTLQTPLGFIAAGNATLFADGSPWEVKRLQALPATVTCQPRGGFVMVVRQPSDVVPLVYEVEQTAADYAWPDMPAVQDLPLQYGLPDALKGVSDFSQWQQRRAEIAAQIQHYGIGVKPAVKKEQVSARMDGDTLIVDVTVGGQTLTLKSAIHYPKQGQPPYALMIGTSAVSLPRQLIEDRPLAMMTFHEAQVNDYSQWRKHHERGEHPFDRLYPELADNGAYSQWAWGVSRLIDGLQQLGPGVTKIDTRHIGVTGCSYAGKMALYSGAFDERIALTIAQEPGGGGAAAWRVSHTLKDVESLERTDYHWFKESMRQQFSGDSVYRLPYDQHELCAMICPRALLLLGNPDYQWLADESMAVSAYAAQEVWRRFGIADRMDWSIVGGHGHCQLPESQYAVVTLFIDRFLLGIAN